MQKGLHDIPHVEVLLVDAHGSTPADAGARMLVTAAGRHAGTVGGGRIEAKAVAEQEMLRRAEATRFRSWNLRVDVGMTCGGTVKLYLQSRNVSDWRVAVFGAGHVTQALARVLVQLPCRLTCIDPRRRLARRNSPTASRPATATSRACRPKWTRCPTAPTSCA